MSRDVERVRRALPVRYPYLMVDRVVEEGPDRVVALKNVTVNEPFFQGHFPEPLPAVMPGTLILEAMAQTAAFLLGSPGGSEGYLVRVESARFRRKVTPGDQLILTAQAVRRRGSLLQAEVLATVREETVAEANLSLLAGEREEGVEEAR